MEAAAAGARRVVGIDLRESAIKFAKAHIAETYPELAERLEFHAVHLRHYPAEVFDCILSKDTFEHIIDLDLMLAEMKRRLKPGGLIYSGFGPLYPSPYGDHDRRRMLLRHWGLLGSSLARVPWAHLVLANTLVRLNNQHEKKQARSLRDLGLNMLGFSDYERTIKNSGLRVLYFDTNRGTGPSPRIFSALRKLPMLMDLCTYNAYCVLENPR